MDIHKHKHLTFLTNYLLKRGHFNDILIQFAHKENVKQNQNLNIYLLQNQIYLFLYFKR